MELAEIIKVLFQYGGTLIMAALFVWVFIQDKTKNNKMLEDNTQMLKVLTESNNNIAKSLDIMKQAWSDLKSFVTISMVVLLFIIVIANLLGATLEQSVLLLVTNAITMILTYYFSRKDNKQNENISNDENIEKTSKNG